MTSSREIVPQGARRAEGLAFRRRTILYQKAGAMAVQAMLLAVAVTVCVVIGRGFQLTIVLCC